MSLRPIEDPQIQSHKVPPNDIANLSLVSRTKRHVTQELTLLAGACIIDVPKEHRCPLENTILNCGLDVPPCAATPPLETANEKGNDVAGL